MLTISTIKIFSYEIPIICLFGLFFFRPHEVNIPFQSLPELVVGKAKHEVYVPFGKKSFVNEFNHSRFFLKPTFSP